MTPIPGFKFYFKTKVLVMLTMFSAAFFLSQTVGDFQTKVPQASAQNWNNFAAWEMYNGTGWVPATEYPGQTPGSYSVTISANTIINTSALTSISIGNLYVSGRLNVDSNLTLPNTHLLSVTGGTLYLNGSKRELSLPQSNAQLSVSQYNGSNGIQSSSCNNNIAIQVNGTKYVACKGNSTAGTFATFNSNSSAAAANPAASPNKICLAQSSTITQTDAAGATELTYKWTLVSAPAGYSLPSGTVTTNKDLGTLTFNIAGTYTFSVKVTKNTASNTASVSLQVLPAINPGTIAGKSVCSKFNNNTLALTGNTGNVQKWQSSPVSDFSSGVQDIANTTNSLVVTNASNTTYYRAVVNNGVCSSNSNIAAVLFNSTTLNGTNWSNGTPDITKKVIFSSDFTVAGNVVACSTEVTNNASVKIGAGSTFTSDKELTVTSGTFTVESDGGFLQNDPTATNSGNITLKRNARMKRQDYTYWGSPVVGQNLFAFSPATLTTPTVRFYKYNEATDIFTNTSMSSTSVFEPAIGYAIRAPNNFTTTDATFVGSFTGVPNNGNINTTLRHQGLGYNLIANPYSSNIDFNTFYNDNKTVILNAAYFWTNVNVNNTTQTTANYLTNNYAQYAGGTGNGATGSSIKPTNVIKPGQGFLVQTNAADNSVVYFKNTQRTTDGNSVFFKSRVVPVQIDRYWLKLSTPQNNFNTLAVSHIQRASNNFEGDYDAPLMVVGSDSFYSIIDDKKLGIQGRHYPVSNDDQIKLGFVAYQSGLHKISLNDKEGIFAAEQKIYLKDLQTGTFTDLTQGDYSFSSNAGKYDDRFIILYKPESLVLAAGNYSKDQVKVFRDGNNFTVRSSGSKIIAIELFDATGKLVFKNNPNSFETKINSSSLLSGVYVIKIYDNEAVSIKRIVK